MCVILLVGTPRFKEDGTLGFEVITSNPNSDKIFGSFSYVIGDNARIACQLGWPQIVIGLETGYEWAGWEEFQVYFTFNSPWMPAKHIDARVKVDGAQVSFLSPLYNVYLFVQWHSNAQQFLIFEN